MGVVQNYRRMDRVENATSLIRPLTLWRASLLFMNNQLQKTMMDGIETEEALIYLHGSFTTNTEAQHELR